MSNIIIDAQRLVRKLLQCQADIQYLKKERASEINQRSKAEIKISTADGDRLKKLQEAKIVNEKMIIFLDAEIARAYQNKQKIIDGFNAKKADAQGLGIVVSIDIEKYITA